MVAWFMALIIPDPFPIPKPSLPGSHIHFNIFSWEKEWLIYPFSDPNELNVKQKIFYNKKVLVSIK